MLLTQALGSLGLVLSLLSYQCKESRRLILVQLGSNIAYVVHMLMLGAYAGCLSLAIMMVSNGLLALSRYPWAAWRGWRPVLCALFAAACCATWTGPLSLLPCAATMVAAMTNWTRNGKAMRVSRLVFVGPAWLIYDIFVNSWSGALNEVLGLLSIGISIYRYGLKNLDRVS